MLTQNCDEDVSSLLDNQGCTILHWACNKGNSKCVEYLVNTCNSENWKGNPFTPIHCSVLQGNKKCLEILLKHFGRTCVSITDKKGELIIDEIIK